jgi:hypothetical protein
MTMMSGPRDNSRCCTRNLEGLLWENSAEIHALSLVKKE